MNNTIDVGKFTTLLVAFFLISSENSQKYDILQDPVVNSTNSSKFYNSLDCSTIFSEFYFFNFLLFIFVFQND